MVEIRNALERLKSGNATLDLDKIMMNDILEILHNKRKEFISHPGFRNGTIMLKETGHLHAVVKDKNNVFVTGGMRLTVLNPKDPSDNDSVFMSLLDSSYFSETRKQVFQLNGTDNYVEALLSNVNYSGPDDINEQTKLKLVTYHLINKPEDEGLHALSEDLFFANFTPVNYEAIMLFKKYVDKLFDQRKKQTRLVPAE